MSGFTLRLERFAYMPAKLKRGTFGWLSVDGHDARWLSVEQDWEDNKPFLSCIPEGEYNMTWDFFHRGGYGVYEIGPVPGRTHIKMHRANWSEQLFGCVAPGLRIDTFQGQWTVAESGAALAQLHETIRDVAGDDWKEGRIVVSYQHNGPLRDE